jgi:hypothetical protein
MANWHWILKLIAVGVIGSIDYSQGKALIGFSLAAFYLLAALWSLLIRRDRNMFRKRLFMFALFTIEVMAIASLVEHPLDLGILDRWVHKQAE